MRAGDVAPAFHVQRGRVAVAGAEIGQQRLRLVAQGLDIECFLFGPVGDAQAAAHVDELQANAQLCLHPGGHLQQHLHRLHHVAVVALVRGQHGVQAKAPRPPGLGGAKSVEQLGVRHAVFGLQRVADDAVAAALGPGVVAKAHQLGHLRHLGHQAQVVQVQDAAAVLRGHGKFLGRGVVGGEHDLLAACAGLAGQHQLGDGAAIKTAAQLTQQGQDARVGQRLDGVILFEPGHLGKGRIQAGHSGADAGLVVEMKGRAEVLGNGWQLGVQALAKIVGNGHGGFSVCCIY